MPALVAARFNPDHESQIHPPPRSRKARQGRPDRDHAKTHRPRKRPSQRPIAHGRQKSLDQYGYSSWRLKKSLRFRTEMGRREIFRLRRAHPEESASESSHFHVRFTRPDTRPRWEPIAWAVEQGCKRRRRRRTRRGPWRGRALSLVQARPRSSSSRSLPRCVCAAAG